MDTLLSYIAEEGEVKGEFQTRMNVNNIGELRYFAESRGFKVVFDAGTKAVSLMKTDAETGAGSKIQLKVNDGAYTAVDADSKTASQFKYVPAIKDGKTVLDVKELNSVIDELNKAA